VTNAATVRAISATTIITRTALLDEPSRVLGLANALAVLWPPFVGEVSRTAVTGGVAAGLGAQAGGPELPVAGSGVGGAKARWTAGTWPSTGTSSGEPLSWLSARSCAGRLTLSVVETMLAGTCQT
jgi:hypothetical protein